MIGKPLDESLSMHLCGAIASQVRARTRSKTASFGRSAGIPRFLHVAAHAGRRTSSASAQRKQNPDWYTATGGEIELGKPCPYAIYSRMAANNWAVAYPTVGAH